MRVEVCQMAVCFGCLVAAARAVNNARGTYKLGSPWHVPHLPYG